MKASRTSLSSERKRSGAPDDDLFNTGVPTRNSNESYALVPATQDTKPLFHSNVERELLQDYSEIQRKYDKKNNIKPLDNSAYDVSVIATSLPDPS